MMIPNLVDAYVGHRLRLRCQEADISTHMLAEVLGVPEVRVVNYQKGHIRIGAVHLMRIARALRVSVGYFFEGMDTETGAVTKAPRLRLVK